MPSGWLGLDIGGTKVAAGVVDEKGDVWGFTELPTRAEEPFSTSFAQVVTAARTVMGKAEEAGWQVRAVGAGCPGPLDPVEGVIHAPPNLPAWDGQPVRAKLEDALGLKVACDNDGNLAALAEARQGAGRGYSHLVLFTLGTGVGGGVIVEGEMLHGARGAAGELGHLVVDAGGLPCSCGGRGCLEAYASGTGLLRRTEAALSREPNGSRLVPPLSVPGIVDAVREGDRLAGQVWEETIRYLAAGVVSAVHAFNPQVVVIGGGIGAAGDILFPPLRRLVAEWGMRYLTEGVPVVPAALGRKAGVIGAGILARERWR